MELNTAKSKVARLALCGFGKAGQIHFHGIRRSHRCELKYIVDLTEDESVRRRITSVLDEYHVKGVVLVAKENIDDVMKDPEINGVVVATPTDSHEYFVCKALQAHKAVFCEKPVAADSNRIQECYRLAEEVGRPLFCAFNRRFDISMSRVHDQVRSGSIGKVYQVKTTSRDSPFPSIAYLKKSSGIFHDCAIHDIDMACWVVGERPVSVFAQGSAFDPEIGAIGDVDTAAIVLKFPNGVLASIDVCRHCQYGYDQRLEVLGSKGMLQVRNVQEDFTVSLTQGGESLSPLRYSFPERYKEAYELEMDHFVTVILDPSVPLKVTQEEVLLSNKIANACERSLKEGRTISI